MERKDWYPDFLRLTRLASCCYKVRRERCAQKVRQKCIICYYQIGSFFSTKSEIQIEGIIVMNYDKPNNILKKYRKCKLIEIQELTKIQY